MPYVGVVGCGYWGPNLIRNLVESRKVSRLVACDLDPAKLAKVHARYPTIGVTERYQDLLEDPDVDAVLVATPLSLHYEIARNAILAGKHTFVEKPFTANVSQAEDLIRLAAERNRVLMVGHTFEYAPPVLKIGEILRNRDLGSIYYLSSTRVNLGLHQKDVSVIWDLAPHDLSMFMYWLDEPPVLVSAMGKDFVQRGIPDVAFVSLNFASGAIAHIQVSWLSPSKLRRTTIVGSRKMLVYDDTENLEKVKIFDKGVNYRDPETFGEYQLSYRAGDIVSPKLETFEPLQAEMDHFLECIRNGRKPRTDGRSGLRVVRVLEAAERSLGRGGLPERLSWDAPAAKARPTPAPLPAAAKLR